MLERLEVMLQKAYDVTHVSDVTIQSALYRFLTLIKAFMRVELD